MKKTATAHWEGGLKDGNGSLATQSGALKDSRYGFKDRFEGEPGTNPEELIGAAHAGCFAMAFSMILGEAGYTAESIDAKATVTLEKQGDGFAITASHLDVSARVPKLDKSEFEKLAEKAKTNCPVSKLLKAEITMDAELKS